MGMFSGGLREALGVRLEKSRSLLLIGDSEQAFEAAAPFIEAVGRRFERLRIVLSGPPELRDRLQRRFPEALTHAAPLPLLSTCRRFVRNGGFRSIVALDDVRLPRAMITAVGYEGMALLAMRTSRAAPPADPATARAAEATLDLGGADGAGGDKALEPALDILLRFLARDFKKRRRKEPLSPSALVLEGSRRPFWRRLLAGRIQRIETLDELRARLGAPQTILCLGNGPSSEDPRLDGHAYDALFRVNESWRKRGRFVDPKVVFTGGRDVMENLQSVILGLQTDHAEIRLAKGRALAPSRKGAVFFRADETAPALRAHDWGAFRPSNGAAMIATAVALQPGKLVVAGIDLFRHPQGAYPGDPSTPNAFVTAHDADAEAEFLLDQFAAYRGELVILSPVLDAAWADRRRRQLPDEAQRQ